MVCVAIYTNHNAVIRIEELPGPNRFHEHVATCPCGWREKANGFDELHQRVLDHLVAAKTVMVLPSLVRRRG